MPFIQNTKIPSEVIRHLDLDNFDGGLNNVTSSFELRENESPNLLNVINYETGAIETRPGYLKHLTTNLGIIAKRVFVYETSTFAYFLLSTDTKLYKIPTTGGSITEVCTLHSLASGVQYTDKFYFVDGESYRMFDGTDVYTIIQPTMYTCMAQAGSASTVQLASDASSLNDFYNGWYCKIYSGTGMKQTAQITDYDGTTKIANVTFATPADNTSALYLTNYPQEVITTDSVNKKIVYTPSHLQMLDTFMGANNVSMADDCKYLVLHKQRLYFSNNPAYPNLVHYSDVSNPYYIPTNEYVLPITNDGDSVVGTYSFNNALVIFKKDKLLALFGSNETDFSMKELIADSGTVNIDTVQFGSDYLMYLGNDGKVYAIYDVKQDYSKMATQCISKTLNIVTKPILLYPDSWTNSRAVYYSGHYMLAIGTKMLIFTPKKGWMMWDNINPTAMLVYENKLLFTNANKYLYRLSFERYYVEETIIATEGQTKFTLQKGHIDLANETSIITKNDVPISVKQLSTQEFETTACTVGDVIKAIYVSMLPYSDDGVKYRSEWNSYDVTMNYPSKSKQIKNIFVNTLAIDYWRVNVNVGVFIDYYDYTGGFSITSGMSVWGKSLFGEKFTTRNITTPTAISVNRRGKVIKFQIYTDDVNQPFKIYTINGDVVIKDR